MPFAPSFAALFSGGLVEQCLAIVQNNQAAAIAAYASGPGGFTPFGSGVLDQITDYHKAKVAAPQYPRLTVVAADEDFDKEQQVQVRKYTVPIFVHLDISYTDPDQLADWSYHYARLLDQIFSTVTYKFTSSVVFETAQAITWPGGSAARQTTPFAPGSVKSTTISPAHIGLVPGEESSTPVQRISLALEFEMEET
jgi:hypothetical protein